MCAERVLTAQSRPKSTNMASFLSIFAVLAGLGVSAMAPLDATAQTTPKAKAGLQKAEVSVVKHRRISVDGLDIFYREAGPKEAPALLLLHGFPTSSHMFRHLIPALATQYRVIAPDYPGFGFSAFPDKSRFPYSFAAYAELMAKFTDAVGLQRYAIYIQDYGAPVGLRLALLRPDRITGMIVQNGNAYDEGFSADWAPLKAYWQTPSSENREKLRGWLNEEGTRLQYVAGLPEAQHERFAPENWVLDWMLLNRPGNIDLQLDLFGDYKTNVALYPEFQKFFRERKPPTLIVWGKHDPFFTVAGAMAYKRDIPDAEIHLLDAGHFALESHTAEITGLIQDFLRRRIPSNKQR